MLRHQDPDASRLMTTIVASMASTSQTGGMSPNGRHTSTYAGSHAAIAYRPTTIVRVGGATGPPLSTEPVTGFAIRIVAAMPRRYRSGRPLR
ncbi:hypothetical protein GCM10010968_20010 [Agrococcus terreus]|uniref:Uncharacterized protein n=1 Tax=Agrococcus terreus TaxID=574649 RepID=A0ABQ2KKW1_9MICO|nr:hypothetical protein GCM10010968_20010 [Agrococcus terreus]